MMSTGSFLTALLALLPALSLADVSVPDTPAGRAFGAWREGAGTVMELPEPPAAAARVMPKTRVMGEHVVVIPDQQKASGKQEH
jgi:hypothetical protein